jgi:CHAD domain-containing protein
MVLDDAWNRVNRWRVSRKPASALGTGIERIYRRGRKALASARKDGSAEKLHEWRKQEKYLAQAMESFSAADGATKWREHADAVADALGKDHDFVVLQAEISSGYARLSIRRGPREEPAPAMADLVSHRHLDWADVQALALSEGVELVRSDDLITMLMPRLVPSTPLQIAPL